MSGYPVYINIRLNSDTWSASSFRRDALRYMVHVSKNSPSIETVSEMKHDLKIITERKESAESLNIIRKWVLRSLNSEIDVLTSIINDER